MSRTVLDDVVEFGFSEGLLRRLSSRLGDPLPPRDHLLADRLAEFAGYAGHPLAYNAAATAVVRQVGTHITPSQLGMVLISNGFAHATKDAAVVRPDLTGWRRLPGLRDGGWIPEFSRWLLTRNGGVAELPGEIEAREAWAAAVTNAANGGDLYRVGGLFALTGPWEYVGNKYKFKGEDCPKCGASMEGDPDNGKCNRCGHKWGDHVENKGGGKSGRYNPMQPRDANGRWTNVPHAAGVTVLKSLGGSTGAKLVQDANGNKWIMKSGPSKDALVNEAMADEAYRRLGLNVPAGGLRVNPDGTVTKFTKYLEGAVTLGEWEHNKTPEQLGQMHDQIAKNFMTDALMGNWDVVGMSKDNIMITPDGKAWRVDNGGALEYRAQGKKKAAGEFGNDVKELQTMLNPTINPSAAAVFGDLTPVQMKEQAKEMFKDVDLSKFLNAFASDPKLKAKMEERWHDLNDKLVGMPLTKPAVQTSPQKGIMETAIEAAKGDLDKYLMGLTTDQKDALKLQMGLPPTVGIGKVAVELGKLAGVHGSAPTAPVVKPAATGVLGGLLAPAGGSVLDKAKAAMAGGQDPNVFLQGLKGEDKATLSISLGLSALAGKTQLTMALEELATGKGAKLANPSHGGMFAGVAAKDIPGWAHLEGLPESKVSYGAVLYRKNKDTGETEVLLRKPTGNYDGYHWTFPKGGHTEGDPLSSAKKEVAEETGHEFHPTGHLYDTFKSAGGKENAYFIGEVTGKRDNSKLDGETEALKWVPVAQAKALIERGTNKGGVERDVNVLTAFAKQMGTDLTPKPQPASVPLPVGAKVVDPLHTAGGLHAHLSKQGGLTPLELKKIAFMNPNGLSGGSVHSPKSAKDKLAKLLPAGTVIKGKSISEAEMANFTVPAAPKVGTTAVPAAPTSPPTYKVPDSITAKVKAKSQPKPGGVDLSSVHAPGSGAHTIAEVAKGIAKGATHHDVVAAVATKIAGLPPDQKGQLKAHLGIAKGQSGTNEATVKAVLASLPDDHVSGTPGVYTPPKPATQAPQEQQTSPTPKPVPAGPGTAGTGTTAKKGLPAKGTFVKPTKTMSVDGVHAVTQPDVGAKLSTLPINSVPVSVFAGKAFHQVDEAHVPHAEIQAKFVPMSDGAKVTWPDTKEFVDKQVSKDWAASLTSSESHAVGKFKSDSTDNIRMPLYDALKKGEPMPKLVVDFMDAIQKRPPQPGLYYRGLHGDFADQIAAQAKQLLSGGSGQNWMYDVAPHGMSTNFSTAHSFSSGKVILRVASKSARPLHQVGGYDGEAEVVGVPGARYNIKAVHSGVKVNGQHIEHVIDVEEI